MYDMAVFENTWWGVFKLATYYVISFRIYLIQLYRGPYAMGHLTQQGQQYDSLIPSLAIYLGWLED